MTDIKSRLRKCADHAGVILTDPPRPTETMAVCTEAAAYIERLEAALDTSLQAVMDWVCLYAPDECSEESVSAAKERIREAGGTLGYLADVIGVIRDARATLKGGDHGK